MWLSIAFYPVLIVVLLWLFASPVDHGNEGEQECPEEQYDYPVEQGKRKSPVEHFWSYVFLQVFYPQYYVHTIQMSFWF